MATVATVLARKGTTVVSMVASDSVLNAANLMNNQGIGGVIVTDGEEMIGIFTERDVMRRVVAEHRDPATTTLREVMTAPVVSCRPDISLEDCSSIMTAKRIRHVPVTDENGIVGIVTSGDILAYQAKDHEITIEHLTDYITTAG